MVATIPSATLVGIEGHPVRVEVHVSNGLPGFTVVGLPDTACRESRDRVRAALISSGLPWPTRRVTVNLAPSGLRKAGAGLDLAIAIALLVANGDLKAEAIEGFGFIGELGLDGTLRTVPGVLSLVDVVDARRVVVPRPSLAEAALVRREASKGAVALRDVVDCLKGEGAWDEPHDLPLPPRGRAAAELADVRGQRFGRWALEVAAAGGHHLLLTGPPGSGKTMLARRLPGLLPLLDDRGALETTRIHSAAGLPLPEGDLIREPPMRSPHHTASVVSIIGGGQSWLRPGEISLASNGVLLLDEMAEFPASLLDSLRQPIEEGTVRICRARGSVSFPARFLLVGTMNPCPCGAGGPPGSCRCTEAARSRYVRRLSGPLLDRFDLRVHVTRPHVGELLADAASEPTEVVAARVASARQIARDRGYAANADIPGRRLRELAALSPPARKVAEHRLRAGSLSARGLHRVSRVARTLADLAGVDGPITEEHLCGALELRLELEAMEVL